jgi:Trypsin-co-occurring domain 2
MNLAEFVEESLSEILNGIRAAQKREGGDAIGAEMRTPELKGQLMSSGNPSGTFTVVDFDVSVVAETKGGGKGRLKVWDIGIEGEAGHTSQHTNRVRFSVQLRIPDGAKPPPPRPLDYHSPAVV